MSGCLRKRHNEWLLWRVRVLAGLYSSQDFELGKLVVAGRKKGREEPPCILTQERTLQKLGVFSIYCQ